MRLPGIINLQKWGFFPRSSHFLVRTLDHAGEVAVTLQHHQYCPVASGRYRAHRHNLPKIQGDPCANNVFTDIDNIWKCLFQSTEFGIRQSETTIFSSFPLLRSQINCWERRPSVIRRVSRRSLGSFESQNSLDQHIKHCSWCPGWRTGAWRRWSRLAWRWQCRYHRKQRYGCIPRRRLSQAALTPRIDE